jgi:hypothetical protein
MQYGSEGDEFEIFKFFHDVRNGYFADIGGFDPVVNSTTIYLYARGWRGINFEANWEKSNRFPHVRPEDANFNLVVGEGEKYVTLYEFPETTTTSTVVE